MSEIRNDDPQPEMKPSDDVTLLLNNVFIGIMRTTNRRSEAFASEYALTPARVGVVSALYRNNEPLTVGEIAAKLHVSSTNISRRLDGLEQAGWIQRKRNPGDGRSIYVSLTDYGRSQADAIMPVFFNRLNNVWGCFDLEQKQQLTALLSRFLDHLLTAPQLGPLSPE